MKTKQIWYGLLLFCVLWIEVFSQSAISGTANRMGTRKKKADVLVLLDGQTFFGRIVTVKKDGVVFDPEKESFLYNPPAKFYPFSHIKKLVRKDGQIVYQSRAPSNKLRAFSVSFLGNRRKSGQTTNWPLVLHVNAFYDRGEITATFATSFNVDEGVGCCECWGGETPPHHYRFRYSDYFWKIGGRAPIKNGDFEFGVLGGVQENGWCDDSQQPIVPGIFYLGIRGELSRHFLVGLHALAMPIGAFTAGVTWQSTKKFSYVWVGVLYFGETVPRWRRLRPSFRARWLIQKNWLLHAQMYQLNQPHSSHPSKLFLFGIGRVFPFKR